MCAWWINRIWKQALIYRAIFLCHSPNNYREELIVTYSTKVVLIDLSSRSGVFVDEHVKTENTEVLSTKNRFLNKFERSQANMAQAFNSLYEPWKVWKYLYPSINPTRWQKNRRSVSLHSAMFQEEFCCLLVRKAWVSEREHMEPSRFVRWGHPVTVGAVQCDRCYCRPARQGNKPIPLICHLIPLSTGLPSESTHNMLRMHRHLQKKKHSWQN